MLEVRGLTVAFKGLKAVDDVNFSLSKGEIMGLVGESGSGKTVTGLSLMGLTPASGEVNFNGVNLLTHKNMREIRGRDIAMIFQDPMMTLNPVLKISTQMIEAITVHERISKAEARARCRDALGKVGIPSPDERLDSYPHQFSGGMRQRVAIAIALLNRPQLIIADEPTTALDVTIQAQILTEVQKIARELNTSLIWITHDLGLVSGLADKIAVMYAGRIVESGASRDILTAPRHPYTHALLRSLPVNNKRGERLMQIEGTTPALGQLPAGCAFAPRCLSKIAQCEIDKPQGNPACFNARVS
jgi:peptide/nickel transport system ATP-binding protein